MRASVVNVQISDSATLRLEIANSYFSLARLHYNIGNIDSANYYYYMAASEAPLESPGSARYLYVYSTSVRDTNEQKADSILDIIVATQPKTEHGKAAMAQLGYTAAFVVDTVVSLYNSGFDLMKYSEYSFAIEQFKQIYTRFPENMQYAPKSLYSIGYIFENKLMQYDSAYFYYKKIINDYPNSVYAKELIIPIQYLTLLNSGEPIPEELQEKKIQIYHADRSVLTAPIDTSLLSKPQKTEESGFSFDDLKNPSKLLDKAKKSLKDKYNKLKDEYNKVKDMDFKDELNKKLNEEKEKLIPKLDKILPKESNDTTTLKKPILEQQKKSP